MALFKSKLVRKHYKLISLQLRGADRYAPFRAYYPRKHELSNSHFKNVFNVRNLFKHFHLNRKIFKFIYGPLKWGHKSFNRFHKKNFKKSKKRLYFQAFFFNLEIRVAAILFKARILTKIKALKGMSIHFNILQNGLITRGYRFDIKPLDIVGLSILTVSCFDRSRSDHKFLFYHQNMTYVDLFERKVISTVFKDYKAFSSAVVASLLRLVSRKFFYAKVSEVVNDYISFWGCWEKKYFHFERIINVCFLKFFYFIRIRFLNINTLKFCSCVPFLADLIHFLSYRLLRSKQSASQQVNFSEKSRRSELLKIYFLLKIRKRNLKFYDPFLIKPKKI